MHENLRFAPASAVRGRRAPLRLNRNVKASNALRHAWPRVPNDGERNLHCARNGRGSREFEPADQFAGLKHVRGKARRIPTATV